MGIQNQKLQDILTDKKTVIFFHLLFWAVYIGSITLFFSGMVGVKRVLFRTLISAFFNAILVYANLYFLLPKYFENKKYWTYIILLNLMVVIVSLVRMETDAILMHILPAKDQIKQYLYSPAHFVSVFVSGYLLIILSSSFRFIKEYFINIQLREQIKYQKLEAELNNLKNQLNPHFLFNVLNNIHSLAYLKSDKTAPMVMKLSEMMRYVLYECNSDKVSLKKEIDYLKNYLDLQQMKKEEKMNIEFSVEGNVNGIMIEPLIFLPLFENCFKHGNLDDTQNGWMKSKLIISNNFINLWIENSIRKPHIESNGKKAGGIGLNNLKERLKMLYKDKCEFVIIRKSDSFMVSLMLELPEKSH